MAAEDPSVMSPSEMEEPSQVAAIGEALSEIIGPAAFSRAVASGAFPPRPTNSEELKVDAYLKAQTLKGGLEKAMSIIRSEYREDDVVIAEILRLLEEAKG